MKIASARLIVKNLKKTLEFYIDILDFKPLGIFPEKEHPIWATLVHEERDADHFSMMFLEYGEMDPESPAYHKDLDKIQKGAGVLFYFDIEGVDALYKQLTSKGVKRFIHDIETMPYGLREFTIEDPDGYQLTFCQEVKIDHCLSCGMPLTKIEERGGKKVENPYCGYCTDDKGRLLSRHEIEEKMMNYLIENGTLKEEARGLAQQLMSEQPAWTKE
ncbi:VOC family protein [Candidatus Peregrinibacteria bacterium]|nr:VOC family protein [Candidatus Peregrinibacteria bacterium]